MAAIHYIGHGRLESSPENLSILHVVSHELGHVAEFKREAIQKGEDVVDIKVRVHYEMRENGKLVAVSGETEASFRSKNQENLESSSLFQPYKDNRNYINAVEEEDEKSNEEKNKTYKELEDLSLLSRKEYLEGKLKQLESELQTITQKKSINEQEMNRMDNEYRTKELEREKRRLEEELRLIKLEEETRKNFEFLKNANLEYIQDSFNLSKEANHNKNTPILNTKV